MQGVAGEGSGPGRQVGSVGRWSPSASVQVPAQRFLSSAGPWDTHFVPESQAQDVSWGVFSEATPVRADRELDWA